MAGVRDPAGERGGRGPRGQGGQDGALRRRQHGTPRDTQHPPLLGLLRGRDRYRPMRNGHSLC